VLAREERFAESVHSLDLCGFGPVCRDAVFSLVARCDRRCRLVARPTRSRLACSRGRHCADGREFNNRVAEELAVTPPIGAVEPAAGNRDAAWEGARGGDVYTEGAPFEVPGAVGVAPAVEMYRADEAAAIDRNLEADVAPLGWGRRRPGGDRSRPANRRRGAEGAPWVARHFRSPPVQSRCAPHRVRWCGSQAQVRAASRSWTPRRRRRSPTREASRERLKPARSIRGVAQATRRRGMTPNAFRT
jgi:hypothetical protein